MKLSDGLDRSKPFRILAWGSSNMLTGSTGHDTTTPIHNTWHIEHGSPELRLFTNWKAAPFSGRAHVAIQLAREIRRRLAIPRDRRIEVVVNARGGVSLAEWSDDARRRSPDSMFAGSLDLVETAGWNAPSDVVFGLQGEHDCSTLVTGYNSASDWAAGVQKLYEAWEDRGVVGAGTRFLHGEFGQWFSGPASLSDGLSKLAAWRSADPGRRFVIPSDGLDPEPGPRNASHYSGASKDKLALRGALLLLGIAHPVRREPIDVATCRTGENGSSPPAYFLGADDLRRATEIRSSSACDVYLPLAVSLTRPIDVVLTIENESLRLLCLQPLLVGEGIPQAEPAAGTARLCGAETASYFAVTLSTGHYQLNSHKRFSIERRPPPPCIAVYGTSNGLYKNGYWDGLASSVGGFNSRNHSIGGSAAFVWFSCLDKAWASRCRFAILEYCVNDGLMIQSGANSVRNWENVMTCAVDELRASGCEPVLFVMPARELVGRASVLRRAALDFAERFSLPALDVYRLLERAIASRPELAVDDLFADPAHLKPHIASRIGRMLGDRLPVTLKSRSARKQARCPTYRFVAITEIVEAGLTRRRGTSLLERDFLLMGEGDQIEIGLRRDERLAAIALDLSKTNGCMSIEGSARWTKSWSNPYFRQHKENDRAVVYTVLPVMGSNGPDRDGKIIISIGPDSACDPDETWGMTGAYGDDAAALSISGVVLEGRERRLVVPCPEWDMRTLDAGLSDDEVLEIFSAVD